MRPSSRRGWVLFWAVVVVVFLAAFYLAPQTWGNLGGTLLMFLPNWFVEASGNLMEQTNLARDAFMSNVR